MIRLPLSNAYRNEFRALWHNVGHEGGAYSHLLWLDGKMYSLNEKRRVLLVLKPRRPSVFTDLLGDKEKLIDIDLQAKELYEVGAGDVWSLGYAEALTNGGDEISRFVVPEGLPRGVTQHAIRELTEGFISIKQLQSLAHVAPVVVVRKVEGVSLYSPFMETHIHDRKVLRPRVSRGYVENLLEYPEDGIVLL